MPIDLSALPDELDALRALVAVQAATIARQETELDGQRSRIERLRVQLARLRHMQFGRSSEKLDAAIAQRELALEDLEEEGGAETVLRPPAEAPVEADAASRPARRPLPGHLPRDVVEHAACACPPCGGTLRRLGEDVTEVLGCVPGSFREFCDHLPLHHQRLPGMTGKARLRLCLKLRQGKVPWTAFPQEKPVQGGAPPGGVQGQSPWPCLPCRSTHGAVGIMCQSTWPCVVSSLGSGLSPSRGVTLLSIATRALVAAMTCSDVRRLVCITGMRPGDSRGHDGFLHDRLILPLLLHNVCRDKDRQEAAIRGSIRAVTEPGSKPDRDYGQAAVVVHTQDAGPGAAVWFGSGLNLLGLPVLMSAPA